MRIKRKFCLIAALLFTGIVEGSGIPVHYEVSTRSLLGDLNSIIQTFQVMYAPQEWKQELFQWNLEKESLKAKERLLSESQTSLKSFHVNLRQFMKSARDYHVTISFFSTESATLPFSVRTAEKKVFFRSIDRDDFPLSEFPIDEGDELVEIDGVPAFRVIEKFAEEEFGGKGDTEIELASLFLTRRSGKRGYRIPHGAVKLIVSPKDSNKKQQAFAQWIYKEEKIIPPFIQKIKADFLDVKKPKRNEKKKLLQTNMLAPIYHHLIDGIKEKKDPDPSAMPLGNRKSFLPPLGEKLWESSSLETFHAYLFETDSGKRIGYIRIPSYRGEKEESEEFGKIISVLEENSSGLVIDQLDNPGGSVFYLYGLVSMLISEPTPVPTHRRCITQKDIAEALELMPSLQEVQNEEDAKDLLGEEFSGFEVNKKLVDRMIAYFEFLFAEWEAGHHLTSSTALYGIDKIDPHSTIRYTKPILLLINGLDFSGGDFFPAIMKGRATLFGTRTAGAGGVVNSFSFPNRSGIDEVHYTVSIAERENGEVLENLGITPHIIHQLTKRDMQSNFCDYVKAIHKTIEELF